MTNANLSRIEHGGDFRVTTLLDVARVLGLEPMLVPKRSVPAVRALLAEGERHEDSVLEKGRFA